MCKEAENSDLSGIAKLPATFTCFTSCIVVFNVDMELKPMMYDAVDTMVVNDTCLRRCGLCT
jgi:hypothetical protein